MLLWLPARRLTFEDVTFSRIHDAAPLSVVLDVVQGTCQAQFSSTALRAPTSDSFSPPHPPTPAAFTDSGWAAHSALANDKVLVVVSSLAFPCWGLVRG